MSDKGLVESMCAGLPDAVKKPILSAFRYILDNGAIGGVQTSERAVNFRWYRFDVTTPSVADQEFSIHHGNGSVPLLCWPILPLNEVNARVVRLRVTRAADAQRIYLSSPDTSAAITVLAEF